MQGTIEKVGASKKGNPIITVNGVDYFSKETHPAFSVGRQVSFESTVSPYKGKDYHWVTEGSIKAVESAVPTPKSLPERMKTRCMIASYVCEHLIAKGLVTPDTPVFNTWANHIWDWVSKEEEEIELEEAPE